MTPKQKANQLHCSLFVEIDDMGFNAFKISNECAKQCALIAVNEVLNISYFTNNPTEEDELYKNYWLQVKEELEKM